MFLDHFPGYRRRRRARSGKTQKHPHGIFLRAQRDPRRAKRRVSVQIPSRRFLDMPIFPLQNLDQFWALKPEYPGARIPRPRIIRGGFPGQPRILRKTICIFPTVHVLPLQKARHFSIFWKNIEAFSGHFRRIAKHLRNHVSKKIFEQILLKMFAKNSCEIFQKNCVRERFSQHKSPRPRPPKHAAGPRAT